MFTEYCQACGNPTTSAARPKFCGNCGNPFSSLASLVGATKPQTITTSAGATASAPAKKQRIVYVDEEETEEVIKVVRKKPSAAQIDDDDEEGGEDDEITEVPNVSSLEAEVKSSPVRKVMGDQIVGTSKSGRGSSRRDRPGKKYKMKDFQSEAGTNRQK